MKHAKQTGKRLISLLLTLLMLVGFVPTFPSIVSAANPIPDAPTREQVSVIKFVDAKTNYLGGIALDAAGKVWTWGYNSHGMLGLDLSPSTYAGGMTRIPFFVDNNINIVQIEGGYHTNYALDDNGILYAWGKGNEGQMGNGTTSATNPVPTVVTSLNGIRITKVFTTTEASSATYAIADDGKVYAWGYSAGGRIPTADAAYQTRAKHQPGFDAIDVVDIALGYTHGVLLDATGQVYTWGTNAYGQLGHSNTTTYSNPTKVQFFVGMVVTSISAEFNSSMASTSDGRAFKWGTVYEATPTSSKTSYTRSAGGPLYYSSVGRSRSVSTPELIEFDLSSAPGYYTTAPPVAFVTASRYVSYVTDIYGRVWYFGWNVNYGFATDGPLFTTINGGKHSVYVTNATLLKTLGDGDTQGYMNNVIAPVFSGVTSTTDFTPQYTSYARFGQWSSMGDGLHPSIYDKKYMATTDSGNATSHTYDYPLDAMGRRLVYVIRRIGGEYSGNFYVASDGYNGPWSYNLSSANLPAGVTEETSVPIVKEDERAWIGLVVELDTFDYTGTQLNELPFITSISAHQSSVLFVDNSGNLFKQSINGSGSNAWGWDYSKYEIGTAGNNAARGLYNFYSYELTFMRGAPTVPSAEINFSTPSEKIYLVEDSFGNTPTDTVNVAVTIPGSVTNTQLNLTVEPELTDLRYVFIPHDISDYAFSLNSFDADTFNAVYNSGLYETGNLLSSGQSYKNGAYSFDVDIAGNGKLWVLGCDVAYTRTQYLTGIYYADNFYTPLEVMHRGLEYDNPPGREVYAPTTDNVEKISTDLASAKPDGSYLGIPLDANGNTISSATFGYDSVRITQYDALPGTLGQLWSWYTPQNVSVDYVLSDSFYFSYDADGAALPFVHNFYYDSLNIEPLLVDDLKIAATPAVFTDNGDIVTYCISFTMPDSLLGYESAKIVDVLPLVGLEYNDVATYIVGDASRLVDVSISGNTISYELLDDEFTSVAGKIVTLALEFSVDGWIEGVIENDAELYFKPAGGDYPAIPDALATSEISLAIGPPRDVIDLPGDRKVALLWSDPEIGEVAYYQVKIDDFDWITFELDELGQNELPDDYYKWYVLFEYTPDGLKFENFVEYTFLIRAIDINGMESPAVELKVFMWPIIIEYNYYANLIALYNYNLEPINGWPDYDIPNFLTPVDGVTGLSATQPHTVSVTMLNNFHYAAIHRNFAIVSQDATWKMYSDPGFTNEVEVIDRLDADWNWLDEVHVYLEVLSGDHRYIRYYDVTVYIPGYINATSSAILGGTKVAALNTRNNQLELVPLNRSSALEVGNLVGSRSPLEVTPLSMGPTSELSIDPNNPTEHVIQLLVGETEYRVNTRPGVAGTIKYLYTDPSFDDQYLVASGDCLTDSIINVLTGGTFAEPVAPGASVTFYAKYVEKYPYNPTTYYVELVVLGPPTGTVIYMDTLAGESTNPPHGGAGILTDPFTATIYLPLTKGQITNTSPMGDTGDIIMTGVLGQGARTLYGSAAYTTFLPSVNLDIGENHIYIGILSNGTQETRYYDITAYRGFPFGKNADRLFYNEGDTLQYAVEMTIPRVIDGFTTIRVEDDYDETKVENPRVVSLIGNPGPNETILYEGTDFIANDINGVLVVTLTPTGIGKIDTGVQLELIIRQDVISGASGTIVNTASLYYNGNQFGEAEAKVYQNEFEKTAVTGNTFAGNGDPNDDSDNIIYQFTFKMPEDLSSFDSVKIVDTVPTGLAFLGLPGPGGAMDAILIINNPGPQQIIQMQWDGNDLYYEIPINSNTIGTLENAEIALILEFEVSGWTAGSITNNAELYFGKRSNPSNPSSPIVYPSSPDAEAQETIHPLDVNDLSKDAALSTYTPGGEIHYSVSWTLPAFVTGINHLQIIDSYDETKVALDDLTLLLNGIELVLNTDYSYDNDPSSGVLRVFLSAPGYLKLTPNGTMELKSTFVVDDQASGDIDNNAGLYYNQVLVGEDDETVTLTDFIKTVEQSSYKPGDILDYTIEVTLPNGIDEREFIEIVDDYPAAMLENATVVSLEIGNTTLAASQYALIPAAGKLTVRIDVTVAGHYDFTGDAGEKLVLKLSFEVSANTTGAIRNTADIFYDYDIGGEREVIIEVDDFSKDAALSTYTPGGKIDYSISWTLPSNVSTITSIRVVDNYDINKVAFSGDFEVIIGNTTLTSGTDYTLTPNPAAGTLTTVLTASGLAYMSNDTVVKLNVVFDVLSTATGDIYNLAELFYNGNTGTPDASDDETVTLTDFIKTVAQSIYQPGDNLDYTIEVTLPYGIDGREFIEIVDAYPAALLEDATVVSLVIGSTTLTASQYEIIEAAGVLTVKIDITEPGHYDFTGDAGKKLVLTLAFKVTANATGAIRNTAYIYFDYDIGGSKIIVLDVDDFSKDASLGTYTPGGNIDYTVSWTLPDDISTLTTMRIVDDYDETKVAYDSVVQIRVTNTVGTTITLTQTTDYTVSNNNPSNGILTIFFEGAGIAKMTAGAVVEVDVKFNVDPLATGNITNISKLFFNQDVDPVGEDDETVTRTDFQKTVLQSRYQPGDTLDYVIDVTLPTGIDKREFIEIVDNYPATMLENATVVSLRIGTTTLTASQYDLSNVAGELRVRIDVTEPGHYDFSGDTGEKLVLTLTFEVSANTTGAIRNDADIFYDHDIGGQRTIIIDVDDFTKDAELNVYVPGGTINYTVGWTLPDDVSLINSLSIVDDYDETKVLFGSVDEISVIDSSGTGAITVYFLDFGLDYTVNNNTPSNGMLTIALTPSGIAKLIDNARVEIDVTFNVLATATGDIVNDAELIYNGSPVGDDQEIVNESDFAKTVQQNRYQPGDDLDYEISVTLPQDISQRRKIEIVDTYPSALLENATVESVWLGILELDESLGDYAIDDSTPGIISVTIDIDAGGFDFRGYAGVELSVELSFSVSSNAQGAIRNDAQITYDTLYGGGGIIIIDENNFSKDAALDTYAPGGTIDYTVSWNLPSVVSTISALSVVDNFDTTKVSYNAGSIVLKVGGVALVYTGDITTSDYSTSINSSTGTLTTTLTAAGLAKLLPSALVELEVVFDVLPTATGEIRNNAKLFYNNNVNPDGEDDEIVNESDFVKTVAQSRYVPGDVLDYEISVTLPVGIDKIEVIEIVDVYTASQLTNPTIVSLEIVGTPSSLLGSTEYSFSNVSGVYTVTIDSNNPAHYDFAGDAGKVLILKMQFTVASGVTGEIINDAQIKYDGKLGGDRKVIISENDFSKDAAQKASGYIPGGKLDYTVSWTLLDDISNVTGIRIVDDYDPAKVSFGQVVSMTAGTTTLVMVDDYTFNNNTSTGVLTITLTPAGVAKLTANTKVELKVEFNVLATATGNIVNTAQMYYTINQQDIPGGNDTETVTQGGYQPISIVLEARKTVVGTTAALASGQFEFTLYDSGGNQVSTVTNGVNGVHNIIKFATITSLSAPGTYTYTMRETSGSGNNWTIDTTIHTVNVVVTAVSGNLVATINYPGTTPNEPPTFINTYRSGNPGPGPGGRPDTPIPDPRIPITFMEDHVQYIVGYPDNTVRPDRNVSRAEVATVFFRLLADVTREGYWTTTNYYTDVSPTAWYNNAISVMSRMWIINGYPDGSYRPDGSITRGELAAIAARFARARLETPTGESSFSDITGHWAENDIRFAAALGWVNGYPDGTFRPNQPITRAEFVTLANRMLERVPETVDDLLVDEMIHWVDNSNSNSWYYIAIQEASNSHEAEYNEDRIVPGLDFEYEKWTEMQENYDWLKFERIWAEEAAYPEARSSG